MKINFKYILMCVGVAALSLTSCATNKSSKKIVYKKVETKQPVKPVESANPTIPTTPKTEISTKKEEVFTVKLPEVSREFRAAWVASVANINWPSKKELTTAQQKDEAIKLLDMLEANNFNAVIFQARPAADALYKSNFEPWSYFLTGQEGKAPYPYYDPLEFWVEEAHKRGIELHVWLNPYRAHHSSGGPVTSESMVKKSPGNVVKLKNGMYWFDPADKRTQDHVSEVVRDIVSRYDIDGIHFDDYFYPYASYNGGADFPDNNTWNVYRNNGGTLARADWRRHNVNTIIERIYKEIKAEKPFVKFGISPFGIWKPGYPSGITGSSQYDELYADAKLWLNKGWVDYFSPQLYWPINSTGQSFPKLLEWWKSENTHNRHLWPGLNTVEVKVSDRTTEITNQVKMAGEILQNNVGVIHWSIAGLTKNPSMLSYLKEGPYKTKALVPTMNWIKADHLAKPSLAVNAKSSEVVMSWNENKMSSNISKWILYTRYNNDWETAILDRTKTNQTVSKYKNGKNLTAVALKAVDRLGNESEYVAQRIN
ncbi:family 10 glycosylhydrolase [Empedobacter brevis]|uniref:glycoside hydrolase family 10 protein n=1 Tax=Empedobacter brevis TaxID=247 RepID=UPI00123C9007|nr:family 10 glycosylhydrolase [Empedobacter brevis]QES92962.1 family 10 glycosylhydrolase [Empedobacter brevis]